MYCFFRVDFAILWIINLKVVILDFSRCLGGGQHFLLDILYFFDATKRKNYNLVLHKKNTLFIEKISKLKHLDLYLAAPLKVKSFMGVFYAFYFVFFKLRRKFEKKQHFLISNDIRAATIIILMVLLFGYRGGIILHDFNYPRRVINSLKKRVDFFPVSESVLKFYNLTGSTLIPNGFDFSRLDLEIANSNPCEVAELFGLDINKKWVVGAGSALWKSPKTFYDVAELYSRNHQDAEFIWVGNLPQKYRSLSCVRLFPNTDKFLALLSCSCVFLSTSTKYEGGPESFGRALFEAGYLGCVLISTNVGEPPNYLCNRETAILVDELDVKQMYEALLLALSNAELRESLINNFKMDCVTFNIADTAKEFHEGVFSRVFLN